MRVDYSRLQEFSLCFYGATSCSSVLYLFLPLVAAGPVLTAVCLSVIAAYLKKSYGWILLRCAEYVERGTERRAD